ncbi:amidase [Bordetella genomosp. 10]|uniref:Amidase n=1 Tax=Bordetella genomosp. 10 TaxID=1416804 RepID=A0A261RXM9_9BORD|nr:amidase [Bordetella genomosp. 10]OZI29829.1 amidase [Bordetella genomosp. 10]
MRDVEYQSLDGLGLADLLARKEVTSEELMACAIGLAKTRGAALNALCYERYEESLAVARDWTPRGAFGGIPFLLKDSGVAHVRFPSSLGSRLLNDTTYARNATLPERFEAAGLIPFARTTVPEFCMAPTTEAARNGGPTLNPWDPTRSSGGSSGGAAAAVACGVVPVAHGSDGGGSIRIPAAACGVYGLKTSRGRVPMGPFRGEGWGSLATDGVLSRTVRDSAAALDAIGGYETGAPYAAPLAPDSYLDAIKRAPGRLRIAVWRQAWNDIPVAPECVAAVDRVAALLRAAGHEVVDSAPPEIDYDALVLAHANVLASNIVVSVDTRLGLTGKALADDDLEPAMRNGYEYGKTITGAQYIGCINRFHAVGRALEAYMQDYDIILTPSLTQLPPKLGYLTMQEGTFMELRRKVGRYGTFSAIFNATGQPAASLPGAWTEAGLPVGVQLVGRFGREDLVLQLSAQLEQVQPWAHRIAQPG